MRLNCVVQLEEGFQGSPACKKAGYAMKQSMAAYGGYADERSAGWWVVTCALSGGLVARVVSRSRAAAEPHAVGRLLEAMIAQ